MSKTLTPERLAEVKKICACVPFIDNGAGVTETQQAFHDLINERTALLATIDAAKAEASLWMQRHLEAVRERDRATADLDAARRQIAECKQAGFIDDAGNVRKVLGKPPYTTADGAWVLNGRHDLFNVHGEKGQVEWLENGSATVNGPHWGDSVANCYSTRQAAESAREGDKEKSNG